MPELTGPSADESFNHIGNAPTPSYYWLLHLGGHPNKADPRLLALLGSQQVKVTNPPEYHHSHTQVICYETWTLVLLSISAAISGWCLWMNPEAVVPSLSSDTSAQDWEK